MAKMNWTRAHQVDTRIREGLDASTASRAGRGESPRDRRIRERLTGATALAASLAPRSIPHPVALARLLARPV